MYQFLKIWLVAYLSANAFLNTSAKSVFNDSINLENNAHDDLATTTPHNEHTVSNNSTISSNCITKQILTTHESQHRRKRNDLPVTSQPNTNNVTIISMCVILPAYDPEYMGFQIGIGIFLIFSFILFFVFMHFGNKDHILNFFLWMRSTHKNKILKF